LVSVTIDGHQKYYQANGESPVFGELVGLVQKMVGLIGPLREALAPVADRIEAAIVYGSVASGQDQAQSDIDLMVIGEELDYQTVFEAVQPAERKLGRPVNPNLMTLREWRSKREQPDSFEARLVGKPRLFVLGSDDDIR